MNLWHRPRRRAENIGKIAAGGLDREVILVGHKAIGCNLQVKRFDRLPDGLEEDLIVLIVPEDQIALIWDIKHCIEMERPPGLR